MKKGLKGRKGQKEKEQKGGEKNGEGETLNKGQKGDNKGTREKEKRQEKG